MKTDYDLVVIGGGAAGLVASALGASVGARTLLIEKDRLGGDCTWQGCVPSKALLKSASVAALLSRLADFGLSSPRGVVLETGQVMAHARARARQISEHHSVGFMNKLGVEVLFAAPKFLDADRLEADGRVLASKRFIVCTGSGPSIPAIEGLPDVDFLTNRNVFDLPQPPKSLVVLGAGPIGVELAQAFARLGTEVFLVEMLERILAREDKEITDLLTGRLKKDGVKVFTSHQAVRFAAEGKAVRADVKGPDGWEATLKAEKVLVAVGRRPNLEGLGLKEAGVRYSAKGIEADATLRTAARRIYAAGDVVGPYQFSHAAEYQAATAAWNALFPFKRRVDYGAIGWATFTDPEAARLGLTEDEARQRHSGVRVYRRDFKDDDRAVTDREETGFVKIVCDRRNRILGAHIAGPRAGELLNELILLKAFGKKLEVLSPLVPVYPTLNLILKRAADQYLFEFITSPRLRRVTSWFLRILR